MSAWKERKNWSDRFLPEIKRILGEHLIGEAPFEEDAERNTDLMTLHLAAVRIGCRVRTHPYLKRYPDEFTIRTGLPSGALTEMAKILSGWGDYFFYGFSDAHELALAKWTLINLNGFRLYVARALVTEKRLPGQQMENFDGSSSFHAFSLAALPSDAIVASEVQS